MPRKDLRILQVNAHRSRPVMDEIWAAVKRYSYDLVVVSEPNLKYVERVGAFVDKVKGSAIIDASKKIPY